MEQNVPAPVSQSKEDNQERCMHKNYEASRHLHLEIDAFSVGLGAGLQQVRDGMNIGHDKVANNVTPCLIVFASKIQFSAEWCYSNIEWKPQRILYGLEKFQPFCFAKEVCVIIEYKSLVAIIKKGVATFSHWFWYIMLHIQQYRVRTIY